MRQFYVFIKCELGRTYDAAAGLVDNLDEAPMVHSISGEFDLLAQFTLEDDIDIGRFVNQKVQTVPGVRDTQTIICFNAFTRDRGLGDG